MFLSCGMIAIPSRVEGHSVLIDSDGPIAVCNCLVQRGLASNNADRLALDYPDRLILSVPFFDIGTQLLGKAKSMGRMCTYENVYIYIHTELHIS